MTDANTAVLSPDDVVLLSGVRTAIGTLGGALAETPASDLAAAVIREAVARAGIEPAQVDQVILGCVGQVAEDAYIARHASVKAGMPIETPGTVSAARASRRSTRRRGGSPRAMPRSSSPAALRT